MAGIGAGSGPQNFDSTTGETDFRAMTIATTLFFMWGFLTSLNDVLIPHLKAIFSLSYTQAMFVNSAFFSAFFFIAAPAGKIIEWIGYKRTMIVGLAFMTVGALLFIPASKVPSFGFFLGALLVLASGVTILQVSANPYVANLGPQRTASSRLNLSQAFNSLGTLIGPPLGGWLILSNLPHVSETAPPAVLQASRLAEAASVQMPYLGIAVALATLAIALALIRLPAMTFTQDLRPGEADTATSDSLSRHPQLWMGALGIFLYVGAEVSIGSFLINYFQLPMIGGLTAKTASFLVGFYWGGAMVGRFIGSALLRRFSTGVVLGCAALIASLLVVTSMLTFGHVAIVAILAVGLFNSIMFPSIFTLGIEGLGPLTGRGSSVMIAAIVGGAILPVLQGKIADGGMGVHHAFILPVLCYFYIAFFGFTRKGYAARDAARRFDAPAEPL